VKAKKIKRGTLVRWLHPEADDLGIVIHNSLKHLPDSIHIYWFSHPEHSGPYMADHELLEIISEP